MKKKEFCDDGTKFQNGITVGKCSCARKRFFSLFKKVFSKRAEGFTFVETMAVLAIGAVLSAGSIVSASRLVAMARKNSAKNQISQFSSALQTYFLDCGRFPTTEQGIRSLWEKPVLYPVPENWNGPYIDREPGKDPWGHDFEYISAESSALPSEVPAGLPFVLISYGSDGQLGGENEGVDIVSWK
ncbi:MAG: type II secretion system major pseudopilin GspG [Treponema sp.]|nr:type II secretion system major pseudopilin GspG [Treponema sp.]